MNNLSNTASRTVLFCPLNWGLGHIARDVPLINEFTQNGYRVIVATEEPLTTWIKTEIPEIDTAIFSGPVIRYSSGARQLPALVKQLPAMIRGVFKETQRIKQLVIQYHPDIIVSDNRYGARCRNVKSVIITHQLMIKLPGYLRWLEGLLHQLVKWLVLRFDECWVPDNRPGHSLAGDLVHKYPLPANARLIGPLSRFDRERPSGKNYKQSFKNSIFAIVSGPEPQRTIMEALLRENMKNNKSTGTIVTGQPGKRLKKSNPSISLLNHLPTDEMARQIVQHETIVCRSGYSTLMDMHILRKTAWLVPTPGQPEQEYLALFHSRQNTYHSIHQNQLTNHLFHPLPSLKIHSETGDINFREALKSFF